MTMCVNRLLFSLLLIAVLFSTATAQRFNAIGYPETAPLEPAEFDLPDQLWCVAQDKRGIMYFGSTYNGIYEYDGSRWRNIPINTQVTSILAASDGAIYVGLAGDFGYLRTTDNGFLEYASLTHLLPDTMRSNVSTIQRIYQNDTSLYFCSVYYIYALGEKGSMNVIALPRYSFMTSVCGNDVLVGNYRDGLYRIINGQSQLDPMGKQFCDRDIYNILPITPTRYWAFTTNGIWEYDQQQQRVWPVADKHGIVSQLTNDNGIPYTSQLTNKGRAGIGYIYGSIANFVELDSTMQVVNIINQYTYANATLVTGIHQQGQGPLWLVFADGTPTKVYTRRPYRQFGTAHQFQGQLSGMAYHRGSLYVSTDKGIFRRTSDANGFTQFKPIVENADVWAMIDFKTPKGNMIVYGSMEGLFTLNGEKIEMVEGSQGAYVNSMHLSPKNANRIYVGTNNTLYYTEFQPATGKFKKLEQIIHPDQSPGAVYSIAEDGHGNVWAYTSVKNLLKINLNTKKITEFGDSLPAGTNRPMYINDTLFVFCRAGIMHYSDADSSFHQGGLIGQNRSNVMIDRICPYNQGYIAGCTTPAMDHFWIEQFTQNPTTKQWESTRIPFSTLPDKQANIHVEGDTLWLGYPRQLYSYVPDKSFDYNQPFSIYIRRMVFGDSVLFGGSYPGQNFAIATEQTDRPTLRYAYNSLQAHFSATFFDDEEATQYSHYLEGSNERTWSRWDNRTEVFYTNLSEGRYTLHVKARNVYGVESNEATFSFRIRPPWYRSILAYFLYVVAAALIVWRIVKWYTKRLVAENERLEQIVAERTAEVVAQKEEIDEQNREITSSIQYASRIQQTMLSPSETVNTVFPDNFILYLPRDIVSGDFYVITQVGNKKISVVADCTGHGVPGGFMSMLGMSSIAEIINKNANNLQADVLLNQLREKIIRSMHQTGDVGTSKDGMDLALYIVDEVEMSLDFAGANNPLVLIRDGEVIQIKPDKMPIGVYIKGNLPFTSHKMELHKGDVLYTFSDGYADQFGGSDKRKFMSKNLRNLLFEIHQKPMAEQRYILERTLLEWHGPLPRIDDVVVMGVRI